MAKIGTLPAIIFFALFVRVAFHFGTPILLTPDSVHYWALAVNWAKNWDLYPCLPFRTPGLAILYGFWIKAFGSDPQTLIYLQGLLGLITTACLADASAALGGKRAGIIVGTILAIMPSILFFESYLMTETLTAALISLSFWSLARFQIRRTAKYAFLLALFSGLLILTRHSLAPLSFALLAWPIIHLIKSREMISAVLCAGILLGVVAPWAVYVHQKENRWAMTISTGWQIFSYQVISDFFDPTIPIFSEYKSEFISAIRSKGGQNPAWRIREILERNLSMAELDDKFMDFAKQNIGKHPFSYLSRSLHSLAAFLGFKSPNHIFSGESEQIMLGEAQGFLSRAGSSRHSIDLLMSSHLKANLIARVGLSEEDRAYLARTNNTSDGVSFPRRIILKLEYIFWLRCWLLGPLILVFAARNPKFMIRPSAASLFLLGYILTAFIHGLFLADMDRYSFPLEPTLVAICLILFAKQKKSWDR